MSNFTNLFSSYPNGTVYSTARDNLLESAENPDLKNGVTGSGIYGYGRAYTIGYGYDISQQTNGTVP